MNILYLAPDPGVSYYQSGGAGTHIRGTINELKKKNIVHQFIGYDILNTNNSSTVVSAKQSVFYNLLKKIIPKSIKNIKNDIQRIKWNKRFNNLVYENIKSNHIKIDVIYERSGYGYDAGLFLSRKLNIPYVIESDIFLCDFHSHVSFYTFNKFTFKKLEYNKLNTSDRIVVMSKPSIELIESYWGVDNSKVRYKGLGIEISSIDNSLSSIREKYKLNDKYIVGFTGIFQPYHNIDKIIDVAEEIDKIDENIFFLIVGSDPTGIDYNKTVLKRGLNNIIFTGLVSHDEIADYYKSFDIGIIPGCAEFMYPVKYLEYFNFDKGVIIPRYSCFSEFYTDRKDFIHFSFEANNVKSMTDAIVRVSKDKKVNTTHEVYEYIKENNTWESCGNRLNEIFDELI